VVEQDGRRGNEREVWYGRREETYFSGALDVLCVAGDEAGVLHVVGSGGLLRHAGCVCVVWKRMCFGLNC
jgi:hypothetical protein